ncbi:hypothetical protein ACWEL8_09625 [Streptomyces sp. NPDC004690]
MTAAGSPGAENALPPESDLARRAGDFRLRMSVIATATEKALDTTRDRYGHTVHTGAAADALARRNQAAIEAYTTHLAPHTDALLDTARRALDELPPARHITAWRTVLDALGASAAEISRALDRPATPGSPAERTQHAALWPHLAAWADHGLIAADLVGRRQRPAATLTGEEQQTWTEAAEAAQRRGELQPAESWYTIDGLMITLAYLFKDDTATVVALSGDPDAPGWQVIGHYATEYEAGQALPAPVTPGVLRPDVSQFIRPEPAPEVPLHELVRDVVEAQTAGEASDALLAASQHGYDAGPMVRLQELLEAAGKFAAALETVRGQQIAARLTYLSRQIGFLTREVHDAAEDLGATVAVLPPHRVPAPPRIRPRPAVTTSPPAPPTRSATPSRRS